MLLKVVPDAVTKTAPICLSSDDSVLGAAQLMRAHKIGAVLVQNQDKLLGLVTDRDVTWRVVAQGIAPDKTPLADIMTKDVVVIPSDETVVAALDRMTEMNIRHLPLQEEGALVGVVAIRDIYAAASRQLAQAIEDLRELPPFAEARVIDVMPERPLLTISGEASVHELAELMLSCKIGAVVVVEGKRMVGIVTERDISVRLVALEHVAKTTPVRQIMTQDPQTISAEATCEETLQKMQAGGFRHMPVVADGLPVGMVSIRDLNSFLHRALSSAFQDSMVARQREMMQSS